MPNAVSNVNFGTPTDYGLEAQKLERQRALAQVLQQQGMQPLGPTESVGGWAIQKSPMEGLGKIAQSLSGAYQQSKLDQRQKELYAKQQQDLADWVGGEPTAASEKRNPVMVASTEGAHVSIPQDQLSPDELASRRLSWALRGAQMNNPLAQTLGTSAIQTEMRRKNLAAAMQDVGMSPGGATPTGAGGSQGGSMPSMQQLQALMLSGDPTLMKYAETMIGMQKGIAQRPGAPIRNPITGAVIAEATPSMQPGIQFNSTTGGASPVPGYAQAQDTLGLTPLQEVTNPDQTKSFMPRSQLAQEARGAPYAPTPQGGPQPTVSVAPSVSMSEIQRISDPAERAQAAGAYQAQAPQPNMPQAPAVAPRQPVAGPPRFGQTQEEAIAGKAQEAQAVKEAGERGQLTFEAPQARASVAEAGSQLDRAEAMARQLYNHPGLSGITGMQGMFPNAPAFGPFSGDAANAEAALKSLKAQIGFGVLQAMRSASKTGGALGAISDRENELLQNAITALDTKQSAETFKERLKDVIDYAQTAKQRILRAYQDQYERVQGNQGMTPSLRGAIPTGSALTPAAPGGAQTVKWGDLR